LLRKDEDIAGNAASGADVVRAMPPIFASGPEGGYRSRKVLGCAGHLGNAG
jgi:hypothetical protein